MEHNMATKNKETTPKVTSTKIIICKSTPFLIRNHHLDDTQMKSCLHYDRTVPQGKRTYSYTGEVIKCVNSLQKNSGLDQRWNIERDNECEYYEQNKPSKLSQTEKLQKNTKRIKIEQQKQKFNKNSAISSKKNLNPTQQIQAQKQIEDYELQQTNKIRQNLSEQAEKLRRLYKQRAQNDIKQQQSDQIQKLSNQIYRLKMQNLQLERHKWQKQIQCNKKVQFDTQKQTRKNSISKVRYDRAQLIIHKNKFRNKHCSEDTDSSFSSFELL